jgi:hypothetical protein
MRYCYFAISLLILFACESSTSDSKVNVSQGYLFLNQGSISSIDYFDIETDSISRGVFQQNNNGETLSGYAEHLNQNEDFYTITLQGTFGSGVGGKVILLNDKFEKVAEVTDFPSDHNTLYTMFSGTNLFVSYRKSTGSWPNTTYSYTVRKFEIAENSGSVSVSQIGNDYESGISDYGFGRIVATPNYYIIYDNNRLEFVDISSNTLLDVRTYDRSIGEVNSINGQVLIGFHNLVSVNNKENISNGGLLSVNGGSDVDSVYGDYGIKKNIEYQDGYFWN